MENRENVTLPIESAKSEAKVKPAFVEPQLVKRGGVNDVTAGAFQNFYQAPV